jgi:hypothetical protein
VTPCFPGTEERGERERPGELDERPQYLGGVLRFADRHHEDEAPVGKRLPQRLREVAALVGVVRDVEHDAGMRGEELHAAGDHESRKALFDLRRARAADRRRQLLERADRGRGIRCWNAPSTGSEIS